MEVLLLTCSNCEQEFYVCRKCYRGQTYCSNQCSTTGYSQKIKSAKEKYQKTLRARKLHALRQSKYRDRLENNVTYKSSKKATLPLKSKFSESKSCLCCSRCGIDVVFFHIKKASRWIRLGRPKLI